MRKGRAVNGYRLCLPGEPWINLEPTRLNILDLYSRVPFVDKGQE